MSGEVIAKLGEVIGGVSYLLPINSFAVLSVRTKFGGGIMIENRGHKRNLLFLRGLRRFLS